MWTAFNTLCRPVFISSRLPNIPLFEISQSQIFQLICVFVSPKLQLAGCLVEIIIPRYLGLVWKISHYLAKYPTICPVRLYQPEDLHYAQSLNLKLMKTRFVTSRLFPKSEIAGCLAIWDEDRPCVYYWNIHTRGNTVYRICRRKGRSIFGWEKIKKSGCGVYATTTKFSGQNITSICTYGTIWTVAWLDNGTGQF